MLKLFEITKEYKVDEESVLALHNVSVEFRRNEFVSILGPSGCGKTTLLNIIGGLDRYTSGDIQIDGVSTEEYDDVDWDTYRNKRIGFVFQAYNLIPHMTVLKNVQLSLTLAGVSKEEGRARAMEALRRVGLEKQAKKKPNQMSGGQMQRVAIARALVNNPDIILADEPTGALDSESGLQVMELLKEVARDRLVIMVTHNGQLAEEYSTRIINLKDGEIVGDTMPYDSSAEEAARERVHEGAEDASAENASVGAGVKKSFFARVKEKVRKLRASDKSSMSVATAINLSWTNLLSKKGRTLLTSIAGSIGIIGIVVVLALSNGVGAYIQTLEENALSQYPITLKEYDINTSALLSSALSQGGTAAEEYPDGTQVGVGNVLGSLLGNIEEVFVKNDLKALKQYLDDDNNFDKSLGTVKYGYGTTFNVYADDPAHLGESYMKVNPFTDAMGDLMGSFQGSGFISEMANAFTSTWDELSANQQLLDQQYELLGDSRWPQTANEVVVVVDKYNQLPDFAMFMLGLRSQDHLLDIILPGHESEKEEFYKPLDLSELLGKEYKLIANSDYYVKQDDGTYNTVARDELDKGVIDSLNPLDIKVVGIVRPRQGVTVTSINGYVGYTHALTEMMLERASESDVAATVLDAALNEINKGIKADDDSRNGIVTKKNFAAYYLPVTIPQGVEITYITNPDSPIISTTTENGLAAGTLVSNYSMHVEIMRALGVADKDTPQTIKIYPSSFDNKAAIEDVLRAYGEETGQEVKYTDNLAIIMSFVREMSDTVTNVLVGFAAISLIVSTIMIAIIIYTSVLERRKEIGVLRSLGARKKDISRVFIAESGILGAYSGAIGVLLAVIFSVIGELVLRLLMQIEGLMAVSWWQCVTMFFVSILLSILAGFIPSRMAAKKDPTAALRSE